MKKCILSGSYNFDGPAVQFVPMHRRGVDDDWMRKHANHGVFHEYLQDLRPVKGKTIIHVLAVGDEEFYGPNRNCDGFSGADNVTAHRSFKDIGHVFKHHQNQDPFKAVGEVLQTAYNQLMHRIELLLALDNEKCRTEVDSVERGEDLPVSMGCFTAGHRLTLDDGSTILLEEAKVGDRVLTHTGAHRPITYVFKDKRYTGTLYRFSSAALESIEATAEHPFFVIRDEAVCYTGHSKRRVDPDKLEALDVASDGRWVAASEITEGDYLVSPIHCDAELPDYMSISLARVLGYYAAEGYVCMTPDDRFCSVQFSMNKEDAAVTELPLLLSDLGITPDRIRVWDSCTSEHECYMSVSDSELAYRCSGLCGRMAKEKRLDYEMMILPVEYQLAFLGALINGNGCAGSGAQEGALYISTASPYYRDQLKAMLARVGVTPGCNTLRHRAGKEENTYSTTEYQVYIPRTDAPILAPHTMKVARDALTSRRGGRRLRVGNYILTPVGSIETREAVDEPIYNVEVSGDNSYVINGVGVHNSMQDFDVCSYCGHRAPTAQAHCDHIKKMLGMVLEDGRRIYMKNPKPKYFDISLVFKPADRIAYTLRKVAGAQDQVLGGHELADLFGFGDGVPKLAMIRRLASILKETPGIARLPSKASKAAGPANLSPATCAELRKQAQLQGVEHLLAFLSANGWLLSPGDLGRTIGHQTPNSFEVGADQCGSLSELLEDHSELPSFEPPVFDRPIRLSGRALEDLQQCCSMEDAPVRQRVMRITIVRAPKLATVTSRENARAYGLFYGAYKLAFAQLHERSGRDDIIRNVAVSFPLRG